MGEKYRKTLTPPPESELILLRTLIHDLMQRVGAISATLEGIEDQAHALKKAQGELFSSKEREEGPTANQSIYSESEFLLEKAHQIHYFLSKIRRMQNEFPDILKPLEFQIELSRYLLEAIFTVEKKSIEPTAEVSQVIKKVAASFNQQHPQSCQVREVEKDDSCLAEIESALLSIALFNLLENAWKAMKGRGNPKIKLAWMATDVEIKIFVEDNGPGMPPAIFKKFGELGFTTGEGGSGLGTSSVSRTMQRFKGYVLAETQTDGKCGTKITLVIPRVHQETLLD